MKYEPLKGKERVVQFVGNLRRKDGGIHKMLLINRGFLATDVKSAVQGLLEEIEKEIDLDDLAEDFISKITDEDKHESGTNIG